MMFTKKTVVLLAGGLGSRYQGLKQIDGILENGSPIMEYSIFDAIQSGFNKIVFIINDKIPAAFLERITSIFSHKEIEIHWVYQNLDKYIPENFDIKNRLKPWGTAHAVLCAKEYVQEPFIVLNADDLYGKISFQKASFLLENNVDTDNSVLLAYPIKNTLSENGTVSRGVCSIGTTGYLEKIEEKTKIQKVNNQIGYWENEDFFAINENTLVSMNFWILHPSIFNKLEENFHDFLQHYTNQEEFFLPTAIQKLVDRKEIKVSVKASPAEWMGVTYPEDKEILQLYLKNKIQQQQYPNNLWNI